MRYLLFVFALSFTFLAAPTAQAEREHRVRSGQSLARIARRYHVRVHDLAAANELRVTAELREGQVLKIPEDGYHYVRQGQSLSEIAREHQTTVSALLSANDMTRENARIRPGQRLLLPGQTAVEERNEAAERWGRPRNPGVVRFYRVSNRERLRVRLLGRNGAPRRAAMRRLEAFLADRRSGDTHAPDRRLVELLSRTSDHFGGRTIQVMSGYRPAGGNTRESSRHVTGAAVDIRIQGVPNTDLRDYLRTFDSVGVGYYPNSNFVHLDIRDRSSYWVDRSGRGEPADYVRDRREREEVDPSE